MLKNYCAVAVSLAVATLSANAADLVVPKVTPQIQKSMTTIINDASMQKIYAELMTDENAQERFNTHVELARIASPSRYEMRRANEIMRRMVEEWGFDPKNVMTNAQGTIEGAGIQKVGGLPVYNACVRIPGTYSQQKDAQSYKGQYPKVLLEGHIDTVNPSVLPPADHPYSAVKLQKATEKVTSTRDGLAALKDEMHFDKSGKVIEDENYKKAYRRFANLKDAQKNGGYRIYVPGFRDAMGNTTSLLMAARLLKKYNIKPVYDIWICGTAGEEGKGNLAGMKQLYGYNEAIGKGNNALNIVANFSADQIPVRARLNYVGSYRFEMQYSEPQVTDASKPHPSALMAASGAVSKIADLRTPTDFDKTKPPTTYTVGTIRCDGDDVTHHSKVCTINVDMRSPIQSMLNDIRAKIEPAFKAALDEENSKYGLKSGEKGALEMKLVWFGDRPAYKRPNYQDIVSQIYWQSGEDIGIDKVKGLNNGASSLNDNIPATIGVPTVNFNVHTMAATGGGHTFYEWGIPGNAKDEAKRIFRWIVMGLTAAGFNTSTGEVVAPVADPIGSRTTEDVFEE